MKRPDPTLEARRLRELLRRHDPATGAPGLDADERDAMRRTVLRSIPEASPPALSRWRPAVVATAAAVALSLGWAALQPGPSPVPDRAAEAPAEEALGRRVVADASRPLAPAGPSPASPRATPAVEPSRVAAVDGAAPTSPREAPADPAAGAVTAAIESLGTARGDSRSADGGQIPAVREVRYRAPGGTRIVWLLNPELTL